MKTVKVLVYTIITVAIVVFLIAPPVIGLWVKHEYKHIISNVNRSNPNLTVTMTHYDFSWFTSKFTIKVDVHLNKNFTSPKASTNNVRFISYINIKHGPIIIKDRYDHHNIYLALADMHLDSPVLNLEGHSIWHFNLTFTAQFSSPSFQLVTVPITFVGKNLQGMGTLHLPSRRLKCNVTLESLSAIANDINKMPSPPLIRLKQLSYQTNIYKKGLVDFGKQAFTAQQATLSFDPVYPIVLSNLSATSETKRHLGKINLSVHYGIQSISHNKFGISGLQFDFMINGVDEKHYNQLLEMLSKKKGGPKSYQSFVAPGLAVLQQGLNIDIKRFTLQTQDGNVSLVGTVKIPKLADNTSLLEIPMMIHANFFFQAPKTWVQQQMLGMMRFFQSPQQSQTPIDPEQMANALLQQWQQQQLIIISGNDFKTHIQFQNGRLLFNGKIPNKKSLTPTVQPPENQLNSNSQPPKTDSAQ